MMDQFAFGFTYYCRCVFGFHGSCEHHLVSLLVQFCKNTPTLFLLSVLLYIMFMCVMLRLRICFSMPTMQSWHNSQSPPTVLTFWLLDRRCLLQPLELKLTYSLSISEASEVCFIEMFVMYMSICLASRPYLMSFVLKTLQVTAQRKCHNERLFMSISEGPVGVVNLFSGDYLQLTSADDFFVVQTQQKYSHRRQFIQSCC